jgi:hypothetical protein
MKRVLIPWHNPLISTSVLVAADTHFSEPLSSNGLCRLSSVMSQYIHACIHTNIHSHVHTCIRICMHVHKHTLTGNPCGGGVEYFHRDPASRRRRRKGRSQLWDSKIWFQVPRDSDPRKTALARASSTNKRQTRSLVREGAPKEQDRNCHTSNKDLVVSLRWVLYSKTDWPADRRS